MVFILIYCQKIVIILYNRLRETDIENRPMDTGGKEEEEGELYGESNIEVYNTICKIDNQWEFVV